MLSAAKRLYRAVIQLVAARPRCFAALSMTFFLVGASYGQQPAPRVYTYVEQMPQLPGGGGTAAVAMELMKRARVRTMTVDLRKQFNSHAAVYFEVSPTGIVQHVKLLRATGSVAVDSSLATAARSLPRFTPGRQNGRPVTVSLTMPMTLCLQ